MMNLRNVAPNQLIELRNRLRNEMLRRSGKDHDGNLTYEDRLTNFNGSLDTNASDMEFVNEPSTDSLIEVDHGRQVIDTLLNIRDLGDLYHTIYGAKIPDDFDYDKIIAFIDKLEKEPYDGSYSSCRSSCTGLCVGMCGNTCDSMCNTTCTGCTNTCADGCGKACTGCTDTCGASCGEKCSNGCTGTESSCNGSCTNGCTGCGGQCSGCTGCQGCTNACVNGCRGTCNTTSTGYACTDCTGSCNAACGSSCEGESTTPGNITPGISCLSCGKTCGTGCATSCANSCRDSCSGSASAVRKYVLRIHQYEEIYATETAIQDIVTVPECIPSYSDDTFIGYSLSNSSVDIAYKPGDVISLEDDLDLYAVFSYQDTEAIQMSYHKSVPLTSSSTNIRVSNAVKGERCRICVTTINSVTQGTNEEYDGTHYFPVVKMNSEWQAEMIASNSYINYTHTNTVTPYEWTGYTGVSSASSVPLKSSIEYYGILSLYYIASISQNDKKYRVYSHDKLSTVNVYDYDTLIESYSIKEGYYINDSTVGIATGPVLFTDDTFYGITSEPDSTTIVNPSLNTIIPHGIMNVYIVHSYSKKTNEIISINDSSYCDKKYDLYSGPLNLKTTYRYGNSSGESRSGDNTFLATPPYNSYGMYAGIENVAGDIKASFGSQSQISYNATYGDILHIVSYMHSNGNQYGGESTSFYCSGTIPAIIDKTYYRTKEHIK